MKLGAFLVLIASVTSSIVDTEQELICASDTDCYPKLFVPSRDWKSIRPGQDIPPGLHVRLNIDTLQREAKLMDEDDMEEKGSDLIVKQQDEQEQKPYQIGLQKPHKIGPFPSELTFESAIEQIKFGTLDKVQLTKCLDLLSELSHDYEYGEKLTLDKDIFLRLNEIIDLEKKAPAIVDLAYRIMASSLRNNPQAIKNFLQVQDKLFVSHLLDQLTDPSSSDIIQKRILGVIQALLQNDSFRYSYFNINDLYDKYTYLGDQAKIRFINILQDLGVDFDSGSEKRSNEEPDNQFSNYVQAKLAKEDVDSASQFKVLFNELTRLHESNKSLKPTKEFLQWLSKEVETRKQNSKRDNDQIQFDNEMLRARHVVFGNPNALRKAMMDEL